MSEQALPYVEVNPKSDAKATVIWLHGLGDSGNGFAPIVPDLKLPDELGIRFVFPMHLCALSPSIMVCQCALGTILPA
jgi:phospholipase/carboxylesterase